MAPSIPNRPSASRPSGSSAALGHSPADHAVRGRRGKRGATAARPFRGTLAHSRALRPRARHHTARWRYLMTPDSLRIARLAAGAAIKGVDRVYRHQADNAFCAMRPPGHHAEAATAMGFCFYNNIAVAAAHARSEYGARRVAILDFDVHQCNGTIDIFQNDPGVLICTSFQYPFYPWRYLDCRAPNVVNTPLPAAPRAPPSVAPSRRAGCRPCTTSSPIWYWSRPASTPIARIPWPSYAWVTKTSTG